MSFGKKILAGSLVAALLALIGGLVGIFVIAPSVAETMVRERLDRVEERLGVEVTTSAIETKGIGGVEISDLAVKDPKTGRTIAAVETVGARVSLGDILLGDRVIESVWTRNVRVIITREADGSFDLVNLIRNRKGSETTSDDAEGKTVEDGGILRHFGGTLPELDIADVVVTFELADGAPVFPIQTITIPAGEIEHDGGIALATSMTVESVESESWSVPRTVDAQARFSEELVLEAMNVKFDRPVELGGLEPYPFLRAGFTGMEMADRGTVAVTDFHLGFQSSEAKDAFLKIERVGGSLANLSLDPSRLRIGTVVVEAPHLDVRYDETGAGELTDLDHAIRAPVARRTAATARAFAAKIADKQKEKTEPLDEEEEGDLDDSVEEEPDEVAPGPDADPTLLDKVLARLPERISVENADVKVEDLREVPVARPARNLEMKDGNFVVLHDAAQKEFGIEAAFTALADAQKRGSMESKVKLNYDTKQIDADVEVDALDLSWAGQILGPRVAQHVRGGTLRAKVGVKPGKGREVVIDGLASVENLVFFHGLLAEEPVTQFDASYSFVASYDPTAPIPDAKLLQKGLFKEGKAPPKGDPMYQGALVFQKGEVTTDGVKMGFTPAVYGTGALPGRLPARVDLRVNLPTTPFQAIFDAVPAAIQGPLQGSEFAGTFAWKLDAEIPLHRAGDMEWNSVPVLEEFEIVSMPKEMHPKKLMEGFTLTIVDTLKDKKGEEYEWSRTVRIPKAEPVSAKYLVENGGISIETLDERRREREWPPSPDPARSFLPKLTIESPEYWYTTQAENQTAKKPWTSYDRIERTEKSPYGPYVFVPLQHIAPWVVRTVTTTEDGGFFRHPGFLFDSLKESVEDNIEAQRMRRGGSTISMQLVKNAFLDRKKLIARKIREAFLVFLMESVVDVPKARILEVYLNVIEFGPAIYGIHDASVHYFGKRPDELTIAETAWLFSILPSPKRYHFYWDRGEITKPWFHKMGRYIDAMFRREKITAEQRDEAKLEPPAFYKPDVELDEPVLKPKSFGGVPLLWDGPLANPGNPPSPGGTTPGGTTPRKTPGPPGTKQQPKPTPRPFFNR